jgi:hypothetical protein
MRNIKIVQKLPKDQQIDAGRMLLARCWFDQEGCSKGLVALRGYQFAWDPKRQCFSLTPLHTHASNGSDAYLQLAVGMKRAGIHMDNNPGVFGMSDGELMDIDEDLPIVPQWSDSTGVFA